MKKYVGTTSGMTDSKDDGNDGEETVSSAEMQHREQMRNESTIGMLSNFRTLPVDRIHNMLKMFVNSDEHKYDKTMDQLEGFLDALANEGKLEAVVVRHCKSAVLFVVIYFLIFYLRNSERES